MYQEKEKKSVNVNLVSIIYAGIVVKSVKPYGTILWCNNRLFGMVKNTIFVHIIIVRGKLGLYHENNTSMSIIFE